MTNTNTTTLGPWEIETSPKGGTIYLRKKDNPGDVWVSFEDDNLVIEVFRDGEGEHVQTTRIPLALLKEAQDD